MGAIAAVVMALAADLTREEMRMRIMAVIGMSIGVAFMLSMVLGPILAAGVGISGIFWITALLAVFSILVVIFITPDPQLQSFHRDAQLSVRDIGKVLGSRELLRLDFGVFVLHMVLSATFVLFPLMLRDQLQVDVSEQWKTYLSVFVLSIFIMVPMIIFAEKKSKMKSMFLVGILCVGLAEFGLSQFNTYASVFSMLVLFFAGFNFLEASLPSLVAKIAPADMKGTAMGLFSTAQFLGAFAGGTLGGLMLAYDSHQLAFIELAGMLLLWWLIALFMHKPQPVSSRIVSLSDFDEPSIINFRKQLETLPGVQEFTVYLDDKIAYLKIDKKLFDNDALDRLMAK
jgi:predicted MFS family arabinose efflux permease